MIDLLILLHIYRLNGLLPLLQSVGKNYRIARTVRTTSVSEAINSTYTQKYVP